MQSSFYQYQKNLFVILIGVLLVTLNYGCGGGYTDPVAPNKVPDGTRVLVANSLGETLSTFSFNSGTYVAQNNFAQTGQAPNQIIVRNGICYILNSLSNSILALDANTFTVIFETSVGLGKNPYNMAFINNDEILISNWMTAECMRINVNPSFASNRIIATIPLPSSVQLPKDTGVTEVAACPQAIVVVGDTGYVTLANLQTKNYTAGGPGLVAFIDLNSNTMLSTLQTLGRNTVGLCRNPQNANQIYVLSLGDINPSTWIYQGNGVIDILDIVQKGIPKSIPVSGAPSEMVVASNGIGYVADLIDGKIQTFDTSSNSFGKSIAIAEQGTMSYISGLTLMGNSFLFVIEFNQDQLVVIDLKTSNAIVDRILTGDGPDAIALL